MNNLAALEVNMINVHDLSSSNMIKKAKEGLQTPSSSSYETKLIAVTILTSMDETVMQKDLGLHDNLDEICVSTSPRMGQMERYVLSMKQIKSSELAERNFIQWHVNPLEGQ